MEKISKVEERMLHQIENDVAIVDVKIDLSNYLNHKQVLDKNEELRHTFLYETIEEQDCLLM